MSDQYAKDKHSRRLHDDETHIKKRTKLVKEVHHRDVKEPHKLHKVTGMNCGNKKCVLCGNPRKVFKELTIQEQKFYQERLYDEREAPASIHEDSGDIREPEYSKA
jgi:hypothetical protein